MLFIGTLFLALSFLAFLVAISNKLLRIFRVDVSMTRVGPHVRCWCGMDQMSQGPVWQEADVEWLVWWLGQPSGLGGGLACVDCQCGGLRGTSICPWNLNLKVSEGCRMHERSSHGPFRTHQLGEWSCTSMVRGNMDRRIGLCAHNFFVSIVPTPIVTTCPLTHASLVWAGILFFIDTTWTWP